MATKSKAASRAAGKSKAASKAADAPKTSSAPRKSASGVVRVHAPNRGYSGISAGVQFVNGEATVHESNTGALDYFRKAGYGVDADPLTSHDKLEPPAHVRPAIVQGGTPLRDAAVQPRDTDFLAPTHAGEADPHGPMVVSPQVHADGPKGVRPGPVDVDAPAEQDADETELAERVLVNNEDKPTVLAEIGAEESREQHEREAAAAEAAAERRRDLPTATAPGSATPTRNASQREWAAYAIGRGMDPEEADLATRAELIKRYAE